jgi:hypothetical protein
MPLSLQHPFAPQLRIGPESASLADLLCSPMEFLRRYRSRGKRRWVIRKTVYNDANERRELFP